MPKLVWASVPLLLVLVAWGLLLIRGHRPSRHVLNVASSLLLLLYLLGTAGLGVFWVARQQLPVFDWHYVFGYATLALLVVHLIFNARIVWRTLTGPRRPSPPVPATAPAAAGAPPIVRTRRSLMTALPILAAGLGGYLLGRRDVPATASWDADRLGTGQEVGPGDSIVERELAEVGRYHALSSHSRGRLWQSPPIDWGGAPPPLKRLDGERRSLPPPRSRSASSSGATGGSGSASGLARLSAVLWHTAGITERRGGLMLRASPSSGALFSTELYAASQGQPDVPDGLWHHDPGDDTLVRLPDAARGGAAAGRVSQPTTVSSGDPPTLRLLATAVFRRTGHKYRDRTYRYVWADLGHALENLRQAASAVGWRAEVLPAFDTHGAQRWLGVDGQEEGVLAWVDLHEAGMPSTAAQAMEGHWSPLPLPTDTPLGLTSVVHARTSLRYEPRGEGRAATPDPRGAVPLPSPSATPASSSGPPEDDIEAASRIALPPPRTHGLDPLTLIARRRSRRRFSARPIPLSMLGSVLAGMALPPVLSTAVRIDLVVHSVDGLPPRSFRYLPQVHALQPRTEARDARALARGAALDQDVIGDAAAVFVLSVDRSVIAADPLRPLRGYRHAFIEAGMVGERVYLEAVARGLGACGVGAFYDDEAAALVGVDIDREWPVHFAALGWPA